MALADPNALPARARSLEAKGMNGLRLVQVYPDTANNRALLDVQLHNANRTGDFLLGDFSIAGGHRLQAGRLPGQVRVTGVAPGSDTTLLQLTVEPIGDYSTYTLTVSGPAGATNVIDPIFDSIDFKFRPSCFNIDCAPEWTPSPPPLANPVIDYLAKDYDSFRHTLIAAVQSRVAGWTPTSEADLSQVLIDLFSAAADELSDYQDRVMTEAYFLSARKRVSLARHARLMDYHIYQGNQASTWLALRVSVDAAIPGGFPNSAPIATPTTTTVVTAGMRAWTGGAPKIDGAIEFYSRPRINSAGQDVPVPVFQLLNELTIYSWGGTEPALAAGDTSADLTWTSGAPLPQATAVALAALFNGFRDLDSTMPKAIDRLLIQEHLNPITGEPVDFDRTKRQLLQILDGPKAAAAIRDPVTDAWMVRVNWEPADRLAHDYCFTTQPVASAGPVPNVSLFHGNLIQVYQGSVESLRFFPPGVDVESADRNWYDTGRGAACVLAPDRPVLYQPTPRADSPTRTTVVVSVNADGLGDEAWSEDINLIHHEGEDRFFLVETDELLRSLLRFGDGTNGLELPDDAIVEVGYQSGLGAGGNVGADTVVSTSLDDVLVVWNPFDVTDGAAPEPVAQIIRNAPEAFRARQLRAITLADYAARAEELTSDVQEAAASYGWTGSWRTVRIAIDPLGAETLSPDLVTKLQGYLDSVRLLGEDLELRPPKFVPLVIAVQVCIAADFWPEDVLLALEQEFSTGYTPDGRRGFFNPDNWTFGQQLYASELEGRIQRVDGIEHIISLTVERWNAAPAGDRDFTKVGPDEVIRVENDPDHMELGSITFTPFGGRQ